MNLKYTGRKEEITLCPPLVDETVTFNKKNNHTATVNQNNGERLIRDNPKTFKEVKLVEPEVLTKEYLNTLDITQVEEVGFRRFDVDLDMRIGKTKLIKQILDIQAKQASGES